MKPCKALAALAVALMATTAFAQDVTRTPLPDDHPLIGAWRLDVEGTDCHEVYTFKPDGTTSVTSGEEQGDSDFEMSLEPSPKGFYKWVDKITVDNGKKDCMGNVMEIGHVATNWIALHPNGKLFLMCREENLKSCLGPLRRIDGI